MTIEPARRSSPDGAPRSGPAFPHPWARLALVLAFTIHVVLLPWASWLPLAASVGALGFAAGLARVSLASLAARLVRILPAVLAILAFTPFLPGEPVIGPWLGVAITDRGLATAATLGLRSAAALAALCLLLETTPPEALLAATGGSGRVPRALMLVGLTYRYLALLSEELDRMMIGLALKAWQRAHYRARLGGLAGIVAVLGVRTLERGERIHRAMVLRGFDGRRIPGPPVRLGAADAGVVGAGLCVLLAIRGLVP
jgi:cobalt/nickel transport system permease protein